MDHREAEASRAADRYLLDEMPDDERQAFEEHYFGCAGCAAEVEAGTMLAANTAAVFAGAGREDAALRRAGLWGGWKWAAVAFAGLVVLTIAVEELVRIPSIKTGLAAISAPQPYPVFFLRSVVRGNDQILTVGRGAQFVGFSFDLPPGATAPRYHGRLEDESARVLWTVDIPPPASAAEPVNVLVPAGSLASGRYVLAAGRREPSGGFTEISRFHFMLQYR